ncbi:MAG: UMP kinase [Patescibacteria group bacterium]
MENKTKLETETIIISLGGSLIVPDEIDIHFLKDFKNLILKQVEQGKKFIIICGGGGVNRKYNQAARVLISPSEEDLDWVGIAALRLNAELIRVIFSEQAYSRVICDLSENLMLEKSIIVGGADRPGRSSDWDAVIAAKNCGAKKIINLSNIDYVYDLDPNLNPNAKKFDKISWAEYRNIIPKEWTSRLSSPFDPVASKLAQEENIEVVIMNGRLLKNLENYLNGEDFLGTVIF